MKSVIIIIIISVLFVSCANEITEPNFKDIIRITREHYAGIYPNPSNGPFAISFYLLQDAHLKIVILSSQNEVIRHLIDGDYEVNSYTFIWDRDDDDGNSVCSGIYYVRFDVNGYLFREGMCNLN